MPCLLFYRYSSGVDWKINLSSEQLHLMTYIPINLASTELCNGCHHDQLGDWINNGVYSPPCHIQSRYVQDRTNNVIIGSEHMYRHHTGFQRNLTVIF